MTETFESVVERVAVEDDLETALRVLDDLGVKSKRAVSILTPVVRDEVRLTRRHSTLLVERRNRRFVPADFSEEAALDRKQLLTERFFNGAEYVLWGEATVDDHLARIAYLSKLRSGLDETIQTHEAAIDEITSHGVACLNEIRGAA